jgi:hypothetical protein
MKQLPFGVAALALLAVGGMAEAGRLKGPGEWMGPVGARASVLLNETFVGGKDAVIAIVGDGSTDVDIFVRDENGILVAQGIGLTDRERVVFRPIWTGRFTVELRNLGNVTNRVALATN